MRGGLLIAAWLSGALTASIIAEEFYKFHGDEECREGAAELASDLSNCRKSMDAAGVVAAKMGEYGNFDLTVRTIGGSCKSFGKSVDGILLRKANKP